MYPLIRVAFKAKSILISFCIILYPVINSCILQLWAECLLSKSVKVSFATIYSSFETDFIFLSYKYSLLFPNYEI